MTNYKILITGLALLLILALAGCSGGATTNKENKENEQEEQVKELQMDETGEMPEAEDDGESIVLTAKWGLGITDGDWETPSTRLVVIGSEKPRKEYSHAVRADKASKIKYIGEKKTKGEPTEWDFYFETYDNTIGSEYEIIGANLESRGWGIVFLYNDSEKWGGVPDKIIHNMNYFLDEQRPAANREEIAAMEKQQNGRKIIHSEVFGDFSIDGKSHRLMLMRYENTTDGLFKIVLRDNNNNYFTADYPSGLYDDGASWRADLPDEPGLWELLFIGKVAEGLFIVSTWTAPEGTATVVFVAKDGKLQLGKQAREPEN